MYKPIDADVIIIGGGIAGLTAAYWLSLKEPTLAVVVLEGGDTFAAYIGGRAFSVPLLIQRGNKTSHFDLGAQWVCKEQNHLLSLFDSLGIIYQATPKQGKIIIHYQGTYTCEKHAKGSLPFFSTAEKFQLAKYIIKVEALCRKIKVNETSKYIKQLNGKTLEEFINETVSSNAVRAVINHMVFVHCGVQSHEISALFYIFFCISTRGICHQLPTEERTLLEFRIKGGVQALCDRLADKIGRDSIFTDEHVKSITLGPKYVEIVSKHTTYRCYSVIVAVAPKDVLNIKFSPSLHENHTEAIRKTCTSTVTNFVATFEREFWKSSHLSGECYFFDKSHCKGPIDYCTNISSPSKVALTGRLFSGKVTNNKFPIYRSEVLDQLAHYLGEAALYPLDYYERSWTNHMCQMAGWEVGNEDYIKHVSQSYDRMFFAGAETTHEWYGYLAGAVHSGMRAAIHALSLIRPAALNPSDIDIISPSRRRTQLIPFRTYYSESAYAAAENWKLIASVCLLVIIALWKLKRKYLFVGK
ncbi:probable flavin-containing monoamine oxidase A [Anoplophora glabripennis]|uniref:probable flavin-containing monoamine oxidase A n=1 Tax=Anoplophora glabripennis TaxID=217634 RepID=UPI0008749F19|nr:probable flavin-containing monoamine oxidase A [Anoplophora glabripennis]